MTPAQQRRLTTAQDNLRRAHEQHEAARLALSQAIADLQAEGESVRSLALATGLQPTTVQRHIDRARGTA